MTYNRYNDVTLSTYTERVNILIKCLAIFVYNKFTPWFKLKE